MFGSEHYVPVLRGKQGEFWSLQESGDEDLEHVTPLIEVPEIPKDFDDEGEPYPAKSVDDHLKSREALFSESLDEDQPFFLDLNLIPPGERMASGEHPNSYLLDRLREMDLTPIPVVGLGRDSEKTNASVEAARRDGHGLCVRVEDDDLEDPDAVEEFLQARAGELEQGRRDIDVIIDFGPIDPDSINALRIAALQTVRNLPQVTEWRTLTFAATAFPETLGRFGRDTRNYVPRSEWSIWLHLRDKQERLPRLPAYGDYAVNHPAIVEVDPRVMSMSANLRYTHDGQWLIYKGKDAFKHGFDQFVDFCKDLVGRPEYTGRDFSWGDDYIYRCSNDNEGPGNATKWRQVGTTHHLAAVVDQITNLRAP